MNNEVGRPSLLKDDQFLLKIRELVLQGATEAVMQETLIFQRVLGIIGSGRTMRISKIFFYHISMNVF